MVVLVPLNKTDEQTVVNHFPADIMSHHGLLMTISSDRDPSFQGSLWKELMV